MVLAPTEAVGSDQAPTGIRHEIVADINRALAGC
jgi:hypothetical protein